jgi:hypothetical protein
VTVISVYGSEKDYARIKRQGRGAQGSSQGVDEGLATAALDALS